MTQLTEDAIDILLDECCTTIQHAMGQRLDLELRPSNGQHSFVLTDGRTPAGVTRGHNGVRSWITRGTLRSADELAPVLNKFTSYMAQKVRVHKIEPDWKFDNDWLLIMGTRFGIEGPRTLAELKLIHQADDAERERLLSERRQRQRQNKEAEERVNRELEVRSAIQDVEDRITRLLQDLSSKFYPLGDADGELDVTGDTLPAAYHDISKKRRVFKKCSEAIVRKYVEARATDAEILEDFIMLNQITQGKFGSGVLDPLGPQDIRYYFTLDELKAFYVERFPTLIERHDISQALAMDGRWVVTLLPKTTELNPIARSNAA